MVADGSPGRRGTLRGMLNSSIGKKALMAVTGLALFGFVIGHMLGNLQIFLGPQVLNDYAHKLESMGPLLWAARIGLLVMLVVHVWVSIVLTWQNQRARPVEYVYEDTVRASVESRSMMTLGLLVLLFIIYHLLQFTFRVTDPAYNSLLYQMPDGTYHRDVYSMVIAAFSNWVVVTVYVAAQVVLGLHLCHGVGSLFRTLGLDTPRYRACISRLGPWSATIIVLGNISIPLAVLLGVLKPLSHP